MMDTDGLRSAGMFRCPGCMCKREFVVAEEHEYSELPDLECIWCGFVWTTITDGNGERKHQLPQELRDQALQNLIDETRAGLIRDGYVLEDVERGVTASK